ncbi:MAG: HlyD family efflux transporter periplasmic adaptor subunit [Treponema sp.]|jgi:multidrug efflux pump subunit AcrA (membrane-fusion protein)|nr:HlyD family efflux transporter periplasmic adaptor subunit [Treponema sp.]
MMKLNKKTAGGILFSALALFLFFSKTVYSYRLPEVRGVKPSRGSLSKLEIASGTAGWAHTETIYAGAAGATGEVLVREGDRVEAGQALFHMDFDMAAARRKLEETENSITKLESDIRNTQSRLDSLNRVLAETQDLSRGQAAVMSLEIAKVRRAMENARLSFELGSLSAAEVLNAETAFTALLRGYEAEADELAFSLALKHIDLDNLRLAREGAAETLALYRANAVVRAPAAGIITILNVEKGRHLAENSPLASIGVGREFTVECTVSADNNFIQTGDTCSLVNSSHGFSGTVSRVKASPQGKIVSVSLVSDEVSEGETFEITFEKTSAASFTLVPTACVNQDGNSYFLYRIKRRQGIMGEEYYVDRLDVFPGDSDYRNTAIIRGITFFEPVVLSSNKMLSVGVPVFLKNPEDFFEN